MNVLFKCEFGSRLYGTETPDSDKDFKGIFLPSLSELILQTAVQHRSLSTKPADRLKNNATDVDEELYSLHYFLQLAELGETSAIDILHCPKEKTLVSSPEWEFLRNNRSRFYTKRVKPFIDYARGQASKYGCRGSRLNAAKQALGVLNAATGKTRLSEIWDELPIDGEHMLKYDHLTANQEDKRVWDVCGRKMMATAPIAKCLDTVQRFYDAYGARSKMAADNEGIDWKAISHAFRAGYQCLEIYTTGDLIYPLKEAEFLRKVKCKEFHYVNDGIADKLDTLIEQVTIAADKTNLPETVDMSFWNEWLLSIYGCFNGPEKVRII